MSMASVNPPFRGWHGAIIFCPRSFKWMMPAYREMAKCQPMVLVHG